MGNLQGKQMQREKYRAAAEFATLFRGQKPKATFLLAFLFLFSGPLFANEMCVQLCAPCKEKTTDSTCIQINSLCSCASLLDSIQAAETAKAEKIKSLKESLRTNLSENCQKEFCTFKVKIRNDELKYFHSAKVPDTIERRSAETAPDSTTKPEALIALNAECQNFCGFCPAEKAQDSTCIQIESVCRCQAFAEQEARLAEKAKADSLQKIQAFLRKSENLSIVADSICAFQKTVPDSTVLVTIKKQDMTILGMQTFKESPKDTVSAAPLAVLPADTVQPKSDSTLTAKVVSTDSAKRADSSGQKASENGRRFYLGASFHIEQIADSKLLGYETSRNTSIATGLDFLARLYFYKYGSFQGGLGAVYQYNDYDWIDKSKGGAYYYNFLLEIPLELRAGFPAGKIFSPFFSLSVNIRKPLYSQVVWYLGGESIQESSDDGRSSGFYTASDFEVLEFIGFGIEIYRRISVEWQWLVASQSSYADDKGAPYQGGIDTWQIKLEFAF